jgi:hypothetical protein
MIKFVKPPALAALCATVLLTYVADTQGQDKGAPEKATSRKAGKRGKGVFGLKGPKSPEVHVDGTVIFRLPLPNLQKVELDGDFKERFTKGTIPMTKDEKTGAWTATVKVPPGSYQYWFIADGFTMPDPSNTHVRPASTKASLKFQAPIPDGWRSATCPTARSTSTRTSTRTMRHTAGSSSIRPPTT